MTSRITFHGEYGEDELDIALEDFLDTVFRDGQDHEIVGIYGYGSLAPENDESGDNNVRLITGNALRHGSGHTSPSVGQPDSSHPAARRPRARGRR